MTLFIYVVSHFLYMVSHYQVRHGKFIRFFYFFQKKCEKIAEFGTALSFKNVLFSRKACYFIGGVMSE